MLSNPAQNIQNALKAKGISSRVVELSSSTRTAAEAAASIGCEISQIMKSLIFKTKGSHKPILVLASGSNRVNEKTISLSVGEEITKADADFTREVTGFAIGGIPPLGHLQPIETFIDQDLFQYDELWAAAGTPHAVFNIPSQNIQQLTSGKVICVK